MANNHFQMQPLDVDKFIKANDVKEKVAVVLKDIVAKLEEK